MSKLKTLAELKAAWAAGNYTINASCSCDADDLTDASDDRVAGSINTKIDIAGAPSLLFQTDESDIENVALVANEIDDFLKAVDDENDELTVEDGIDIDAIFPGITEKAQEAFENTLAELKDEIAELGQDRSISP